MKNWKLSLFTAFSFLIISTSVLISSCIDNSCTRLTCLNGGTCSENFCRCPIGFDGAECEFKTVERFLGAFAGTTRCSDYATKIDSVFITFLQEPNVVRITRKLDPGKVYTGTAVDYRIIVDQLVEGNIVTNTNIILNNDSKKLEYFYETYDITNPNSKNTCNFYGAKN